MVVLFLEYFHTTEYISILWKLDFPTFFYSISKMSPYYGVPFFQCEHTLYQQKVDVNILNGVKDVLAEVSSVAPSSEQWLTLETSANTLLTAFSMFTSLFR